MKYYIMSEAEFEAALNSIPEEGDHIFAVKRHHEALAACRAREVMPTTIIKWEGDLNAWVEVKK